MLPGVQAPFVACRIHARVYVGAAMLHSSLQRGMEELTAAGVLHEADFNERVLDALHCLPLANAQVRCNTMLSPPNSDISVTVDAA